MCSDYCNASRPNSYSGKFAFNLNTAASDSQSDGSPLADHTSTKLVAFFASYDDGQERMGHRTKLRQQCERSVSH
jgi:hypothetical protein